jgi:hypothetical protein
MNESQSRGRLRLRHLLEVTEAKDEEMADAAPRFVRLARKESAPLVVSAFNLFQTPEPIAAQMVEILDRSGRMLEPSAGLGRIYRALRALRARASAITLVEQSADCCRALYQETEGDGACRLVQGDFLAQTVEGLGLFDGIAMNPPFKQGLDIKHIQHALKFLAPGGRLVAICAAGPRQRVQLEPIADQWIDLPAGAFKSEGTGVHTAIVCFNR